LYAEKQRTLQDLRQENENAYASISTKTIKEESHFVALHCQKCIKDDDGR
jgi:hypothetical protein